MKTNYEADIANKKLEYERIAKEEMNQEKIRSLEHQIFNCNRYTDSLKEEVKLLKEFIKEEIVNFYNHDVRKVIEEEVRRATDPEYKDYLRLRDKFSK